MGLNITHLLKSIYTYTAQTQFKWGSKEGNWKAHPSDPLRQAAQERWSTISHQIHRACSPLTVHLHTQLKKSGFSFHSREKFPDPVTALGDPQQRREKDTTIEHSSYYSLILF